MAIVRALSDAIVDLGQGTPVPTPIRTGDAFDEKDDVVRRFPHLFRSDVEQATAAPGERRDTRRSA